MDPALPGQKEIDCVDSHAGKEFRQWKKEEAFPFKGKKSIRTLKRS
jgi:hypothetical protein